MTSIVKAMGLLNILGFIAIAYDGDCYSNNVRTIQNGGNYNVKVCICSLCNFYPDHFDFYLKSIF